MIGGSVPTLGAAQTPLITDAATLDAKMDFYWISGHGTTDLSSLMIVPENTFLFFLGASGLDRIIGLKTFPAMKQLLETFGPDTATDAQKRSAWSQKLYDEFFAGTSADFKLYPKASIYVPGDILPNTIVNFQSGFQYMWLKGLFQLPLDEGKSREFMLEDPLDLYLALVVKLHRDGVISDDVWAKSKVKTDKQAQVARWLTMDDPALRAEFGKQSFQNLVSNSSREELLNYFENPDVFPPITDPYLTADVTNLMEEDVMETSIEEIMKKQQSDKPYRFFIFSACRGPTDHAAMYQEKPMLAANPALVNSPAFSVQRQLARRYSFSAKQQCDTTGQPILNLDAVRLVMHDIVALQFNARGSQYREIREMREFVRLVEETFFRRTDHDELKYQSGVDLHDFSAVMKGLLTRYALESDDFVPVFDSDADKERFMIYRALCRKLLPTLRATFSKFIAGVRIGNRYGVPAYQKIKDIADPSQIGPANRDALLEEEVFFGNVVREMKEKDKSEYIEAYFPELQQSTQDTKRNLEHQMGLLETLAPNELATSRGISELNTLNAQHRDLMMKKRRVEAMITMADSMRAKPTYQLFILKWLLQTIDRGIAEYGALKTKLIRRLEGFLEAKRDFIANYIRETDSVVRGYRNRLEIFKRRLATIREGRVGREANIERNLVNFQNTAAYKAGFLTSAVEVYDMMALESMLRDAGLKQLLRELSDAYYKRVAVDEAYYKFRMSLRVPKAITRKKGRVGGRKTRRCGC